MTTDMITKFLGYELKEWDSFYKLYVFKKEKTPKDVWELLTFWEETQRASIEDCLSIAFSYTEAINAGIDALPVRKMIHNFLIESHASR